jgi:hypothetical protein
VIRKSSKTLVYNAVNIYRTTSILSVRDILLDLTRKSWILIKLNVSYLHFERRLLGKEKRREIYITARVVEV